MADGKIQYDVNAWLRARGDFAKQMNRNAAAITPLQRRLDWVSKKSDMFGRAVLGGTAAAAAGYAKIAAVVGIAGVAGSFGLALRSGLEFNEAMESQTLSIASMFQLYKQNNMDYQANLLQAKGAMRELFDMTKKSPVEFREGVDIYQGAAAGLIVANQSMQEQMKFMKGAQMLGAIVPDLDAKVIGGQVGRIILGGAGAEFEVWKRLAPAILDAGKAAGVFGKNVQMGQKFTQEFNQLAQSTPEVAMELLKTAVKPMEDLADEYEKSWGGILSTTKSNLRLLAGRFAEPLHEARKQWLLELNKTGFLSDENIRKLEVIAGSMGILLRDRTKKLFDAMIRGAEFLRDNWKEIMQAGHNAAQLAGAAIKAAFFIGTARMIAGFGFIGLGKGAKAVSAAQGFLGFGKKARAAADAKGKTTFAGFFGKHQRATHIGLMRGMKGKRGGVFGMMGKGMNKTFGKLSPKDSIFRNMDKFFLRFASFGVTLAGVLPLVIGLGMAFGMLFTAIGGLAAYLISNWDAITSSIVEGLQNGKVTLVPLLTAAYTFWHRLKMVGEALFGGGSHADRFQGILNILTKVIGFASGSISFFMKAIAISIGVWGALKLAFQGVMKVVLEFMEMLASVGMMDESTIKRARKNYADYANGVQDTFTTVDQLLMKADEIANYKPSKLDLEKIEAEAKRFEGMLGNALGGKNKEDPKKPKGPKVSVQTVNIIQDLRDTDPDRLMAAFVRPLERMADQRVQAYDQLDHGV